MSQATERSYGSRYEPVTKIARGGMADVYEARDTLLDRPVALKVLFPELSTNEAFVERFRREAQAAANLSHPNIVSVFDWGKDKGTYFIVMELVVGRTLARLIREEAPIAPKRVASIGADVAAALSFAHKHGVIHRDIKPSNVLITPDGDVKVADFGIARAITADGDLTQTGSVLGTASYISPEQAQGGQLDGTSDIYSLGVVLYELATGKVPFSGDSPLSIAYKHVKETPIAPSVINPSVPSDLEAIIMKCLEKSPKDRYETAYDLRSDLNNFMQGSSVSSRYTQAFDSGHGTRVLSAAVADPTVAIPVTNAQMSSSADSDEEEHKRSKKGAIIALVVFIVLLLGLGGLFAASQMGYFAPAKAAPPSTATVPAVVGLTYQSAQSQVKAVGLKSRLVYQTNASTAGLVISQLPSPGLSVKKGTVIVLTVSSGPGKIKVPTVTNENVSSAENTLFGLGFNVTTNYVNSSNAQANTVISQTPAGGTLVNRQSTVVLTVSNGPTQIKVPSLVGDSVSQAANTLAADHLSVGTVTSQDSNEPANTVLQQSPASGTVVAPNSAVDLIVSNGVVSTTTTTESSSSSTQSSNQPPGPGT
jgi:serine/threonine protein kinase